MTIKDWVKEKVGKFFKLERLASQPNSERMTFISNEDEIKLSEIKANRIWYVGNGDELLNFYTEKDAIGFASNPIYNRNKRNYFWSLSAQECDIKRVHSGIPKAIIDTITNIVGMPTIIENSKIWDLVAKENDFTNKLTQQARPLTLAEGYGAWKINFDKEISNFPIWEYYDAEYIEYIHKQGILFGIVFKSFYKDKRNNDYVLLETRYRKDGSSFIDYDFFKFLKGGEIEKVDASKIAEFKDIIPTVNIGITGLNKILAVPSRYFYDVLNPRYGKSIYAGKIDLFDMLDEIWSQASQTNRVSTPVEYYSPEVMERQPNGMIGMPNLYNRQFVQKAGTPDGEGNVNQDVITTQPQLNFDKYGQLANDVLNQILTGVLSPATLGIDVARKDNAMAQREKEKTSIMTRNTIISSETEMIKSIVELSLIIEEYMRTGKITIKPYDIDVKYNEFANPTFENTVETLVPMLVQGGISPELFVERVYGDDISEESRKREIGWITEQMKQGEMDTERFLNEERIKSDNLPTENQEIELAGLEE